MEDFLLLIVSKMLTYTQKLCLPLTTSKISAPPQQVVRECDSFGNGQHLASKLYLSSVKTESSQFLAKKPVFIIEPSILL